MLSSIYICLPFSQRNCKVTCLIYCYFNFYQHYYLTDEEKQCESGAKYVEKVDGDTHQNQSKTKSTRKRNGSRKKAENSVKSSGSGSIKPSFPTKKRVQVPQSPLSETPLKDAKFGASLTETNKEGTKEGSPASNGSPLRSEKEDISLSPFFWLRDEEEGEKLSQGTIGNPLGDTDTPTPTPPSFSDLKDSDDENPSTEAPPVSIRIFTTLLCRQKLWISCRSCSASKISLLVWSIKQLAYLTFMHFF